MKKTLRIALIALLFAPLSTIGFTNDLFYGITGNSEVTQLQEFLTSEGVYTGPITGNFYSLTLQGVKNFQSREGITPVAGYFGPLTRTRANEILDAQISQSDAQAVAETGKAPVVTDLQDQISLLLQQVALLQEQLAGQVRLETQLEDLEIVIGNQTDIIAQQQDDLGRIAQNTAPKPVYVPTPPAPVVKTLNVTAVTPTVPFSGFNPAHIQATYTEDGKEIPAPITFSLPNGETRTFVNSPQYPVNWTFIPTQLGTTTVTVTMEGITETIDVVATPFTPITPAFIGEPVLQSTPAGETNGVIGLIRMTQADQDITVQRISFTTDIPDGQIRVTDSGGRHVGTATIINGGGTSTFSEYKIFDPAFPDSYLAIKLSTEAVAGTYTFTVTDIYSVQNLAGLLADELGPPITFTFVVE